MLGKLLLPSVSTFLEAILSTEKNPCNAIIPSFFPLDLYPYQLASLVFKNSVTWKKKYNLGVFMLF